MPTGRPTVLAVEDAAPSLDILYRVLGHDYRVLCATRGQKGIEIARDRKPEIILLDVMLPDMDGYEVCARLKADPITQPIPVIFITAMGEETDEEYGLSLGAIDYITKPLRPGVLRARVRAHVENRQLQQRLLQAQKLEALGTAAGGIAHRVNNLLAAILGQSGLAAMKLPRLSAALPHLQQLDDAVERAADLTRQMLACAGRAHAAREPLDLSRAVEDAWPLLSAGLPGNVALERDLAAALPPVDADPAQMREVIVNLVANAVEAVVGGGSVTISTGCGACDDGEPPPCRVFLRVADTGCGMSPETLARAFDAFFSTKFMGRGMGLAAVQGIVSGHSGHIHAESRPGQGSAFTVYLPCAAANPVADVVG